MRLVPEDSYVHKVLSESDFGRYFNRAMLVASLVCVVPLLRSLQLSFSRAGLGLRRNRCWWMHLSGGFVLAGGLLFAIGFVYIQMGLFSTELVRGDVSKPHQPFTWKAVGKFLQQGFGASLLEEVLFRALLLGALLRAMGPFKAALVVTFFFAIVHFLVPPPGLHIADADIGAGSGFWMIGQIFARFGNPVFIAAEFATLFAVGAVLAWSRLRTGSLWLGIGLHAGWVFALKLYNHHTFVRREYQPDLVLPYVGMDLKIGLIPLVTVCLTGVIAAIALRAGARRRASPRAER
jgi:membrane protease YdiL (CAAX protease family)